NPGFCATTASTKCGAKRGGSLRTTFGGSASCDCWSRVITPKSPSRASDRAYLRFASAGWRHGLKRVGACGRPARKIASLKVRSRAGFPKYVRAAASGPSRRFPELLRFKYSDRIRCLLQRRSNFQATIASYILPLQLRRSRLLASFTSCWVIVDAPEIICRDREFRTHAATVDRQSTPRCS